MVVAVIMIVVVMIVMVMVLVVGGGRLRRDNLVRFFAGQRQERIAFRAGKAAQALVAGEQQDEKPGEQQADKESEGNDGHGVECLG